VLIILKKENERERRERIRNSYCQGGAWQDSKGESPERPRKQIGKEGEIKILGKRRKGGLQRVVATYAPGGEERGGSIKKNVTRNEVLGKKGEGVWGGSVKVITDSRVAA